MSKSFFRKFFVFSFLIFFNLFSTATSNLFAATTEKTWVIATEKFEFSSQTIDENVDSMQSAILEMIPSRIIENLSSSSYRTISGEEEYERTLYTLKNERISLFLQLSSAIRAKDAIFLNDYPEKKFKSLMKEEEKKIKAVQDKIDANLKAQKEAEEKAIKKSSGQRQNASQSEGQKYINLLKDFISSEDLTLVNERVLVYEKGDSSFYTPSANAKKAGYKSHEFEKEMVNAKINSLITGKISVMGDYMAVTVEMFVYPGCKSAGTITEIGSLNDVDFISSSIAFQLSPWISASMPVVIRLTLQPEDVLKSVTFSIDDIVYKDLRDEYVIDSGVHSLRFDADGYKTAITSFNFEGNGVYDIDVVLQERKSGFLFIKMEKPLFGMKKIESPLDIFKMSDEPLSGNVYANGEFEQLIDDDNQTARIKVNGSIILGQFIDDENGSGFFYVPEKLLVENDTLNMNIKTFDKSEYIEKRRKIMYMSYSVFVVSLIGCIFTDANAKNYINFWNSLDESAQTKELEKKGNAWIVASGVFLGVTIGAGCFFGYELYKYFTAADSVLPAQTKKSKNKVAKNQKKLEEQQTIETEDIVVLEESEKENQETVSQEIKTENADDSAE